MSRYLIILEPTDTGYSAFSPDLPGCVSTGATREDVEAKMREAIEFHLDGLRDDGRAGANVVAPLPNESLQLTRARSVPRGSRDHARALAAKIGR